MYIKDYQIKHDIHWGYYRVQCGWHAGPRNVHNCTDRSDHTVRYLSHTGNQGTTTIQWTCLHWKSPSCVAHLISSSEVVMRGGGGSLRRSRCTLLLLSGQCLLTLDLVCDQAAVNLKFSSIYHSLRLCHQLSMVCFKCIFCYWEIFED